MRAAHKALSGAEQPLRDAAGGDKGNRPHWGEVLLRDVDSSLGGIALFADMEPGRRQALERNCAFRRCGAGQQIFDRHSPSTDMLCIVRGAVRIVVYTAAGREVRFDELRTGECFGELACLDRHPRSASAVAAAETVIAAISPALLERVLVEEPKVARRMLQRMARSVRNSTDRIMELSVLGSYNRICAELLRLAAPDAADATAVIKPAPSRADIGARVSTNEGTVSRVLSDLVRADIIARDQRGLVVRDLARLRRLVDRVSGDPEDDSSIL